MSKRKISFVDLNAHSQTAYIQSCLQLCIDTCSMFIFKSEIQIWFWHLIYGYFILSPKEIVISVWLSFKQQSNYAAKISTVAHNCHGKTKTLTAKPKTSRQKQNTSRQNQKPHGKNKILHGKTKSFTAKANTSRQKQILHGKTNLEGWKPGTQGSRKECWAWVQIQHGGIRWLTLCFAQTAVLKLRRQRTFASNVDKVTICFVCSIFWA